jgi:hypothetical protein
MSGSAKPPRFLSPYWPTAMQNVDLVHETPVRSSDPFDASFGPTTLTSIHGWGEDHFTDTDPPDPTAMQKVRVGHDVACSWLLVKKFPEFGE